MAIPSALFTKRVSRIGVVASTSSLEDNESRSSKTGLNGT